MFPIAGPGATVDNKFTEGDPVGGVPATVVTAKFLNDVQAELLSIMAASTPPQPPSTSLQNQVLAAIQSLIASEVSSAAKLPQGYLSGFLLANNSGAPNTTIDVGPGSARDSTNTVDINLTSTFSGILQASGAWAAGTGQNKLDAGAKANSTTYHKFVIRKASDGTGDILYSLSATAPTMPSGYAGFRRIGRVATDASGNIRQIIYRGKGRYDYKSFSLEINQVSVGGTSADIVISGFGGSPCEAYFQLAIAGDGTVAKLAATDQVDVASVLPLASWTGGVIANVDTSSTDGPCVGTFAVTVDAASKVHLRSNSVSGANLSVRAFVTGYQEFL